MSKKTNRWNVINRTLYKKELAAFFRAHDRVRDGKAPSIVWDRSPKGFIDFLDCIGIIPAALRKPSLGRLRHAYGYKPGNMQWEEHAVNSVKRAGTKHQHSTAKKIKFKTRKFRRDSPEATAFRLKNIRRYWCNPVNRAKRSAMIRRLWREGAYKNRPPRKAKHES